MTRLSNNQTLGTEIEGLMFPVEAERAAYASKQLPK